MMKSDTRKHLLAEIASMYYLDKRSQKRNCIRVWLLALCHLTFVNRSRTVRGRRAQKLTSPQFGILKWKID
jgi:hypothetical protein